MNYKAITEKIKVLISDKKISAILVLIVLVIIILLINTTEDKTNLPENTETTTAISVLSITDIQSEIENRLEEMIRTVHGAGNVRVMVSLSSSGEYIYAENSRKENNGEKQMQDNEIVIYESDNGNDEGLIVSVKSPEISGVAVVCDGGNSSVVRAEITELVTSLFGIGADRVYVGCNMR